MYSQGLVNYRKQQIRSTIKDNLDEGISAEDK